MNKSDIIYGIRPIIEAIENGKEINKIFIQKDIHGELIGELKALIRARKLSFQIVPKEKLNRLTRKNHQGVVCSISPSHYHKIEMLLPQIYETGKTPLLLILDRITDVRNFGAIARSALCSGVDAIVIPTHQSAMINSDAIKTSAGALTKLPVCRERNLIDCVRYLQESGLQVFAASERASDPLYLADFTAPTAIVMGSEEKGILPAILKQVNAMIKIPLQGPIASLNVSVASGVILFEAIRQRNFGKK